MMRIALFLATNTAILVLISVVFQVFGIGGILAENGVDLNLQALLVMSAVIGFGGSFISLALSKTMAKRGMKVQVIESPRSSNEQWLVATVKRQAQQAGIGMPEVGVFNAPAPNAFATGMRRNNALVAVSTGLLQNMTRDEVEAVLGHEISHVASGADLAGRRKMIAALQRLGGVKEPHDLPGEFAAFGISGGPGHGLKQLFLSHPPLEQRIAALQAAS